MPASGSELTRSVGNEYPAVMDDPDDLDIPKGDLPDDDPEVVDGKAKLELLRQMEDIERLRE